MKRQPDIEFLPPEEKKKINQWIEGMDNIYKQFLNILKDFDVKRLEPGKKFDAKTMEAIETREEAGHDDEEVLEVIYPTYGLRGQIIRPAKVIVNKKSKK